MTLRYHWTCFAPLTYHVMHSPSGNTGVIVSRPAGSSCGSHQPSSTYQAGGHGPPAPPRGAPAITAIASGQPGHGQGDASRIAGSIQPRLGLAGLPRRWWFMGRPGGTSPTSMTNHGSPSPGGARSPSRMTRHDACADDGLRLRAVRLDAMALEPRAGTADEEDVGRGATRQGQRSLSRRTWRACLSRLSLKMAS